MPNIYYFVGYKFSHRNYNLTKSQNVKFANEGYKARFIGHAE